VTDEDERRWSKRHGLGWMHDYGVLSEQSMELWHEAAGEGRPVLLIHEGICDSRMWESQWRSFPQFHRTVRCDLRGFGQTPLPAEPYSNARDVVELLDRLELGAAALVGVSLGGRVALEVALARPDLVERLVLVGPGLPGHAWSDTVRRYGEEEDAAVARGDLEAAVEANLRMWVDGPNRLADEVDPRVRSFVGMMQRRALELQAPVWEEVEEELLVPDVGSRYAEVRLPTLVLVGSEDVSDIHEIADRLASRIPGARKVVIAGTAHVPSIERPEEFDRLVLAFLGTS
jgi:3-oxoadipate enol-lactonase